MQKIILFDADGVLTIPEELFSVVYARSHGLDPMPFEMFFKSQWHDFVTGKRDLKEHIKSNPDLWQWPGKPEELIEYWCKIEDIRNQEMVNLVRIIRKGGLSCYLATEQERYRGEYMKNVMFKDLFDGYFVSAEIGYKKSDPTFFEIILQLLRADHSELVPGDVIFFDDSQSKVDAALTAGLDAQLFEGIHTVTEKLPIIDL